MHAAVRRLDLLMPELEVIDLGLDGPSRGGSHVWYYKYGGEAGR